MSGDLREAIAGLLPEEFPLVEQRGFYGPEAGIVRWHAISPTGPLIVEEHPHRRWYVRIQAPGVLVELDGNVTVGRVADALVLAGVLPPEAGTQYRAGVRHAVRAQFPEVDR